MTLPAGGSSLSRVTCTALLLHPGCVASMLASRIIDLMCEEIAKHGRQYLRLTCPSSNKKLQEYHLKNGFTT